MTHKIVEKIEYDDTTGLPFITDVEGRQQPLFAVPRNYDRKYMTAYTDGPWPNTTSFHAIPCEMCGGTHNLDYTVPPDKRFYLAFIIAAQAPKNLNTNNSISLFGMYINGNLGLFVPIKDQLQYVLFEPIRYFENTHIEIKFKPYNVNTVLGIIAGGYLRSITED